MGRPSSYTQEIAEKISERLTQGEPLARICQDEGMPAYSTVRKWEDEKPEFSAVSSRARDIGCDFMADDCIRIADDEDMRADDKRIRIETRLRLLGMWNKRYNPKIDLNHGGQPGNPLAVLIAEVSGTAITPADDE